jgi:hypothetical protein
MTCMADRYYSMSPDAWFHHLFAAQSAIRGGVVRRSLRDVERMVGRAAFLAEIRRRGYTAVENAGQVVVFCNAEPVLPMAPTPNPQGGFGAEFRRNSAS